MLKTTTSAIAIAALLSAGAFAQSSEGTTNTTVPLQTQTEGAVEAVGDALEDAGDAVTDAADATADATGDAVEATGDALETTGDAVTDTAGDAVETTDDAVEEAGDAVESATDDATVETTTTETVVTEEAPAAETDTTVTETEVPLEDDATVEAEAPAEGTPVAGQIFEQSADTFLASSLLGTRVQSADGDGIGEVNDMVLGADGSVEGVVVGVGGFLGIGEKDVAVQFDAIQIEQDAETGELTFVLNSTRDELEAAPAFRTQDEIIAEQQAEQPVEVEPAGDAGADTTVVTE